MVEKLKIGWIGLGKMGNPISRNLLKAGYPLTVYDVVQSATAELAREGAKPADSSKAVASDTDVVISMIPDDHALEEVSMGSKGVFEGAKPGCIYIDMSTVSPVLSARVGEAAEAITFGKRGGLNWTQMIDIINNSVVASPLIGFKAQMLKERRFPAAFSVRQMTKDFDLALDTGRAMDVPMPFTALTRQFYAVMKAQGKADLDYFGLAALAQEMAGLKD